MKYKIEQAAIRTPQDDVIHNAQQPHHPGNNPLPQQLAQLNQNIAALHQHLNQAQQDMDAVLQNIEQVHHHINDLEQTPTSCNQLLWSAVTTGFGYFKQFAHAISPDYRELADDLSDLRLRS